MKSRSEIATSGSIQNGGLANTVDFSDQLNRYIRPHHLHAITSGLMTDEERNLVNAHSLKFLHELFENKAGLSDRSWQKFVSLWCTFDSFCRDLNEPSIPVAHDVLMRFLKMRSITCHSNTLKGDAWCIDLIHHHLGHQKPCGDVGVKSFLKRKKKSAVVNGETIDQATSLTLNDLNKLESLLGESDQVIDQRDLAMISLTFSCLLRYSEMQNIKIGDIDFKRRTVRIPFSKTNKSGTAEYAPFSKQTLVAIERYMDVARLHKSNVEEFLFRPVSRFNKLLKGKRSISYQAASAAYKRVFEYCCDSHTNEKPFSTHSPRVGACQHYWASGISLSTIMKAGRWTTVETANRYGSGYRMDHNAVDNILFNE